MFSFSIYQTGKMSRLPKVYKDHLCRLGYKECGILEGTDATVKLREDDEYNWQTSD